MTSSNQTNRCDIPTGKTDALDEALGIARKCSPIIDKTLELFGDASIQEYGREILEPPPPSVQPVDDFIHVVRDLSCDLFDNETAEMLAVDLKKNPVALTANHHGVDYFAQSVQGSLIFALLQQDQNANQNCVLVLSCANIPLDNITYPQGFLIYNIEGNSLGPSPQKIPVFSNKLRRWIVCASAGYTDEMINRVRKNLLNFEKKETISSTTAQCLQRILEQEYGDPAIAEIPDYSRQATLLNHRIWKRLHRNHSKMPRLICLELEKVSSHVILTDLTNSDSLIFMVLFNGTLRKNVFEALDGHRACWKHLSTSGNTSLGELQQGTHFFWGISKTGRKFPLTIIQTENGNEVLRGIDNKGKHVEYPFDPESLTSLIQTNQLIPSIFTCFLVLSFARGVNCLGGYYQAAYLPQMQAGFTQALIRASADHTLAEIIGQIPTNRYLSGMQPVMVPWNTRHLIPAGPVEIAAAGGLTDLETRKILAMSLKDAHLASLFETIPDIAPHEISSPEWKQNLAQACFSVLSDKVVVKGETV